MIALLLLLVPAIQLGFSYYASAATAMALLVTARTLGVLPNTSSITWIAVSATAAAMFLSALFIPGVTEADLWRRAREAFFFFWMIPALSVIAIRPVTISNKIVFAILAVVILFAGIALIQASALAGGRYFGLPSEYFIQNAATLPGLLDLKYSRIRPTGTFGEPSYFAFILISMLVMLIPLVRLPG